MIKGRHVLPGEKLVTEELLLVLRRHDGAARYINNFAGNLKRNLGKAIKRVRDLVLPLISREVVDTLRIKLNDQSFLLSFVGGADVEQVLNFRRLQITNERNPA